jgi:hypothetical protein
MRAVTTLSTGSAIAGETLEPAEKTGTGLVTAVDQTEARFPASRVVKDILA